MTDLVLIERSDAIVTLTLNRPEKLNALNYALIDSLLEILDVVELDDAIRAVILTGSGDRAFSAGGDIHEFSQSVARGPDAALQDFVARGQRLTARLEAFRKPVIAAVNGLAYGGGCEITEAVPLAIASDRAIFGKPEINLGMPPTFGGTQRLPRLAGRKRALELLLTGDAFSPERALELGLVNQVVAHADLLPAAHDLARRILRHSPLAAASILTAVTRGINQSIAEGLLIEGEQFSRMVPTADLREGLDAWIARRTPATRDPGQHTQQRDEPMTDTYTTFSKETFAAFRANDRPGPIHMLNLIRLRGEAVYADGRPATGAEAYATYSRESETVFQRVGGRIVWRGRLELTMIGPQAEHWDTSFIAEYPSPAAFAEMLRDPVYRAAMEHRQAAVADSRLIRYSVLPGGTSFNPAAQA